MKINDIRSVTSLSRLPVLEKAHPAVIELLAPDHCCDIAEAADTHRLFHLLQRSEYEPIMAVLRGERNQTEDVRVYFARLDDPCWKSLRQLNLLPDGRNLTSREQRTEDSRAQATRVDGLKKS